jgi:hypothetical protein
MRPNSDAGFRLGNRQRWSLRRSAIADDDVLDVAEELFAVVSVSTDEKTFTGGVLLPQSFFAALPNWRLE